ncbi:MAG: mercuric ion binding protein [Urechidicola sp.]|jgi:mercuric ion binding protein
MKKTGLIMGLFFFTIAMSAQEKNAKVQIEVDGICGMCKQRIEKAALTTKGVKYASWSVETHQLSLIIDERKTTLKTIQENVAAVGHDTKEVESSVEAYNNLHPCCKYKDDVIIKKHKDE